MFLTPPPRLRNSHREPNLSRRSLTALSLSALLTIAMASGLFTTACKKVDDLTATAVTKDGEIAPALVTSVVAMSPSQIDAASDATAKAMA